MRRFWIHKACGQPWWRHRIIGRDVDAIVCPQFKKGW